MKNRNSPCLKFLLLLSADAIAKTVFDKTKFDNKEES